MNPDRLQEAADILVEQAKAALEEKPRRFGLHVFLSLPGREGYLLDLPDEEA